MDNNLLLKLLDDKLNNGENLKSELDQFKNIDGIEKIQRRIQQEIKFLLKIKTTNQLKLNHILCSNLPHYNLLLNSLKRCKHIKSVDYPLKVSNRKAPLRIDIICDNGLTWIKVIARNPKSLIDCANGRSGYGSKSILDQATEYITLAKENKCFFKSPKVIFEFAHKIEGDLALSLEMLGIEVLENVMENDQEMNENSNGIKKENYLEYENIDIVENFNKINLDITTLLAYISNICNGQDNWKFSEDILTKQAEWERKKPVKMILDRIFEGKQLICCETALNSFMEIVNLLGGPKEKERATEFLKRIEVLSDVTDIPDELKNLFISGKIKPRSLRIFSFGIYHKALTITSNEGFIRSAKTKGIDIPVFIHEGRALTEMKQNTGTQIS